MTGQLRKVRTGIYNSWEYLVSEIVCIAKLEQFDRKFDMITQKLVLGYTQNYTDEVFTVLRLATTSPPTYNLIGANNVKILGKFYEPELVQVDVLNTEEEQ